ncbi:hypothetical protein QOT17_014362 [Balamuthia mandrillaris]
MSSASSLSSASSFSSRSSASSLSSAASSSEEEEEETVQQQQQQQQPQRGTANQARRQVRVEMEEDKIPRTVRTRKKPKTNLLAFAFLLLLTCLNIAIVGLLCATLIVAYDRAYGTLVFVFVIGLHVAAWVLLHVFLFVVYLSSKTWQRRVPLLQPAIRTGTLVAIPALLTALVGFAIWIPVSNLNAVRIEAFDWVDPLTPGSLGGEVDPHEYVYFFGEGAYLPPLEERIYGEKIRFDTGGQDDLIYCVFPVVATGGCSYVDPFSPARSVLIDSAIACKYRSFYYDYDDSDDCYDAVLAAEDRCFENVARALLPSPSSDISSCSFSSSSSSSSSGYDGPSVGLEGLVGLRADMFFENHLLDVSEFDMTLTRLRDTVRANGGRIADDVVLLTLYTEEQFENEREEALIDFGAGVGTIGGVLFCLFVVGSIIFTVWMACFAVDVHHRCDVEMEELRKEARKQRVEHAWRLRDCGKDSYLSLLPSEVMVVVEQMVVNNTPS